MSHISIGPETLTERVADRADVFRIALALAGEHDWEEAPDMWDVLRLAEFLVKAD